VVDDVSLISRLSQLLVAFTLEFDNEFEHRMPHRTAADGGSASARGPWLVSQVMWANVMRLVPAEGLPLRALAGPNGVPKLSGLQRWGYLVVEPDPADIRPVPPAADWSVWPTKAGRRAQELWRPLAAEIEQRWRDRFSNVVLDELRECLLVLNNPDLPHYLPVLGYGLLANTATPDPGPADQDPDLSVLLSQVLGAFTAEFEAESRLSLAISADVLRVIDDGGVRVGDLPLLGGVSKEAVSMAVGYLESGRFVVVGTDPAHGRSKLVRLTSRGSGAKAEYVRLVDEIVGRWRQRYGGDVVTRLGRVLDSVDGAALALGLQPYPDGWRAAKPYRYQTDAVVKGPYAALPHHPMVLHRGGFPDGS
jgi:DNA-binding MarR family transcriptional regulator